MTWMKCFDTTSVQAIGSVEDIKLIQRKIPNVCKAIEEILPDCEKEYEKQDIECLGGFKNYKACLENSCGYNLMCLKITLLSSTNRDIQEIMTFKRLRTNIDKGKIREFLESGYIRLKSKSETYFLSGSILPTIIIAKDINIGKTTSKFVCPVFIEMQY